MKYIKLILVLFGILLVIPLVKADVTDDLRLLDDFEDNTWDISTWTNQSYGAADGWTKEIVGTIDINRPATTGARVVNSTAAYRNATWQVNLTDMYNNAYTNFGLGNGSFLDSGGGTSNWWISQYTSGYYLIFDDTKVTLMKDQYVVLNSSCTLGGDVSKITKNITLSFNSSGVFAYVNNTLVCKDADINHTQPKPIWWSVGSYTGRPNRNRVEAIYTNPFIPDTTPPVIDQSTYNCTSCYANQTIWRNDTQGLAKTSDSTPTVVFTLDEIGNCSIGLSDYNYTDMIADDANTKCSTTDTTDMTCTLPTTKALTGGEQDLYIGCTDDDGNENTTSSSGALLITIPPPNEPTLNTPINASRTTPTIILSVNVTDDWSALINVTFYNGTVGGANNSLYTATNIPNGTAANFTWSSYQPDDYNWWFVVVGNRYANRTSGQYMFYIYSPPNILTYDVITAYTNNESWTTHRDYPVGHMNVTPEVNITINELSNCSIGTSDLNHTDMITADANTICDTTNVTAHHCQLPLTSALDPEGLDYVYISCRDQLGNENTSSSSGALAIGTPTFQYDGSRLLETQISNYNITFYYNTTTYNPFVYINYNGTQTLAAQLSESGWTGKYGINVQLPLIDVNSTNMTFYWNTTTFAGISNSTNQPVYRINITNCTTPAPNYTVNFTIYDEIGGNRLVSDLASTWTYWAMAGDGSLTRSYSNGMDGRTNYSFCLFPSWANLTGDAIIYYEAAGYDPREYHLTNYNLDNDSENINLYLLSIGNATTFQLTVRDNSYLYYPQVTVRTLKYQASTDSFIEVESCITDDDAHCLTHLILEDVDYRFMVVQDGDIIHTTNSIRVYCPQTNAYDQCLLTVLVPTLLTEYNYVWDDVAGLSYLVTHNNITNISSLTYSFDAGAAAYIRFRVSQGTITICNTNSSAIAGVINCDLSGYNGTVKRQVFLARSDELAFWTDYLDLGYIWRTFGDAGLFFLILIVITIGVAAVVTGSPLAAIILTIAALGIGLTTGIGGISTAAFIMLAVAAAFIIFKLRQ